MRDTTFVDLFEQRVRKRLSNVPGFSLVRKHVSAKFHVPKLTSSGFDVGATCETWGFYPEPWGFVAWEPLEDWSPTQIIEDYLALVRMLLSPESRLRIIRRRGKTQREILELLDGSEWRPDDDRKHLVLPFGPITEEVFQNTHFPSRAPFGALKKNVMNVYEWPEKTNEK